MFQSMFVLHIMSRIFSYTQQRYREKSIYSIFLDAEVYILRFYNQWSSFSRNSKTLNKLIFFKAKCKRTLISNSVVLFLNTSQSLIIRINLSHHQTMFFQSIRIIIYFTSALIFLPLPLTAVRSGTQWVIQKYTLD